MNVKKTVKIVVNWNSVESIESAEKWCRHYCNKGWTLASTINGFNITTFIYSI